MQIKNSNIIKSIKRLTAAAVALSLIFFTISPSLRVSAEETWPGDVAIQGPSAVVMDIDSGTVLYDKGGEDQHYPASITKIMTGLLAVEHGNLKDTVTFSDKAIDNVRNDSSNIARDVGEKMTLEECLYGMFLASANECAWAIAEHIGGSEPKFIDMMNEKAKELGCTHTHFANPNGLHMDDHYTCASDMAKIACAAYKNPEIAKIVGTKSYQIPPTNKHTDVTPLHNSHSMLCANRTSKYIYKQTPMCDIDPEKGEGYEDMVWPMLLHYKHSSNEFKLKGITFVQNQEKYTKKLKSTWMNKSVNHKRLEALSKLYTNQFKKGNFVINKEETNKVISQYDWYEKAIWHDWCTREDYDEFKKKYGL